MVATSATGSTTVLKGRLRMTINLSVGISAKQLSDGYRALLTARIPAWASSR